ncbi:glycerophosphodiester phosphodiesterase family protein [Palleronia caenipelagi]|uniref:Phosphodiesterase n=1 Tax=Palleronia caenipelagi TaxID=2489174 RepID=A0A547Q8A3_9RHOB|nr:glycerophosphodiester phosphodiesterase family protein [Palleronia caenipelagi]TRD22612.1 phosphodiesterase [Palleronia caenipelagi]
MSLPAHFIRRPFAHRGLHDKASGCIENSRSAFLAAVEHGYGIELDVQITRDGIPVVFHDPGLERLTGRIGWVADHTAAELREMVLTGGADVVLPLSEILAEFAPKAPVLVEIKALPEQDLAAIGSAVGDVVRAAVRGGTEIAVMSFAPTCVQTLGKMPAHVYRGLTACPAEDYAGRLSAELRQSLAQMDAWTDDLEFVSYDHRALNIPRIAELKERGASILCWTVTTPQQQGEAMKIADQITFESFRP